VEFSKSLLEFLEVIVTSLQIQRQQLFQNLFIGQIILPALGGEDGIVEFLAPEKILRND
jgi:hypothetical protein